MPKVIKPSNPLLVAAGFLFFNNIFCAATNFGLSQFSSLPTSRNEEMMGILLVLLLPVCFEQQTSVEHIL